MDQMKDSIADQHRRRRTLPTKFRCFIGCFGGGASEELEKPQRKLKSKSHNRWFSWSKLRSAKSPKRTVPVESASDKNVNHVKGSALLSNSKSSKMVSSCDELPSKGDEEIQSQPPVAGDVLPGKANKTRSGKGTYLRNSKSMNHLQLEDMKDSSTCKKGAATATSLRKSKSAKVSTNIAVGRSPTVELSQSIADQPLLPAVLSGGGGVNRVDNKVKKTEERSNGSFDRVMGVSIIVTVLIIMGIWGKLCAILCSSAWLYFYPLLKSNYINNKKGEDVVQTNKSNSKSIDELNTNAQLQKKKVVFEGFLQRDH